jgi:hypothetical protein
MSAHDDKVIYGAIAQFDAPDALLAAAKKVSEAGYRHTEAYSSFPVHGVHEALRARKSRLAAAVLLGGIAGLIGGFMLQVWVSMTAYPHITSGKPYFSWPSFVPVIFECTILGAALTAFLGMIIRNGLPRPHHPVFDASTFDDATTDGFFICIEATDPRFDAERSLSFLQELNPVHSEVVRTDKEGLCS